MKIKTVISWDDEIWQNVRHLYIKAFGDKGAKPVKVIQNMLAQGIAELHVGCSNSMVVGMAITGKLESHGVMIIDYLTVSDKVRGHGIGKQFVAYLSQRAVDKGYQNIIIETQAERGNPDNRRRIHFWKSCGFLLTEYVHHYIWVPETYHAMYLPIIMKTREVAGEELFTYLTTFHRLSFRGVKKGER